MKKILVCAFSVFFAVCSSFAGDAASFDDIGFSEDGKYYLFASTEKLIKLMSLGRKFTRLMLPQMIL